MKSFETSPLCGEGGGGKYAKHMLSMLIVTFKFTNNSESYVTQKFGEPWPHYSPQATSMTNT